MDSVIFEGVQYVKASVLAKQFNYTADYIGQLCRAKKVDARLVGRTWHVNPDSIVAHKKKKFLKATLGEQPAKGLNKQTDVPSENEGYRKTVLPVMRSTTLKAVEKVALETPSVEKRRLRVSYEPDEEALLPTLVRKETPPPRTVRIEQVNAKKLAVAGKQGSISFTATELPEVSLSGKLEIKTLSDAKSSALEPEPVELPDGMLKHKEISDKRDKLKRQEPHPTPAPAVETKLSKSLHTVQKSSKTTKDPSEDLKQQTIRANRAALTKSEGSVSLPVESSTPAVRIPRQIPTALRVAPLIATVLALVCVLLLFSSSSRLVVSESGFESGIVFQAANLLDLLK